MKKFATLLILFSIFFFACEKSDKQNPISGLPENRAEPIYSDSKAWLGFQVIAQCGHSASGCNGCINFNGQYIHVDCQGAGSSCTQTARIYLYIDDSSPDRYYAITDGEWDLTDEDFFLIPDRSLFIMNSNGEFINIPEQMLYRDETTGKFIINDIFFSDFQFFENL